MGQVRHVSATTTDAVRAAIRRSQASLATLDHDQLRAHLADFMAAYNFARQLTTLSGLTPYKYIAQI